MNWCDGNNTHVCDNPPIYEVRTKKYKVYACGKHLASAIKNLPDKMFVVIKSSGK